jgi:hypothetical protein
MRDDCWVTICPLLFGEAVATPEATLQTMDLLRQALEYLEGRYAHQLAARKAPPAPAKPPRVVKAAPGNGVTPPRKRRGRPALPAAAPQPEMFGQPTVESGSG